MRRPYCDESKFRKVTDRVDLITAVLLRVFRAEVLRSGFFKSFPLLDLNTQSKSAVVGVSEEPVINHKLER